MKKFKIFSALFLSICITVWFSACGEVPEEAGKYTGAGFEIAGVCYSDLSLSEAYINLGSGGKGVLAMEMKSGEILWSAEGQELSFNIGGSEFSGSLKDGVLKLNVSDGVSAVFLKDGAEMPEGESISLPKEYYGWWHVVSSQGEMPETWIDCCARLSLEDGLMYFSIWDEDGSMEKPMGRAVMGTVDGVPANQWGEFWYSELSEGQWRLSGETDGKIGAEVIKLSGEALDRSGGTFSYEIFLRPWGQSWEDVNKDAVPYFYNSWYLPIIKAGGEMPESFEGAESPLNTEITDREEPAENTSEPAPKPPIPQTPKPDGNGESFQGDMDFTDKEMSGFTDDFGG